MVQGICLYFPIWIQQTFSSKISPVFKMQMKQEPQEEEIPIRTMAALKISRKDCPRQHQPYDLPTWGQIKTLTNQD